MLSLTALSSWPSRPSNAQRPLRQPLRRWRSGAVRARAVLVALLGLPGAAYTYQGQELRLPEVDVPAEAQVDPILACGGVCRDGTHVPLP